MPTWRGTKGDMASMEGNVTNFLALIPIFWGFFLCLNRHHHRRLVVSKDINWDICTRIVRTLRPDPNYIQNPDVQTFGQTNGVDTMFVGVIQPPSHLPDSTVEPWSHKSFASSTAILSTKSNDSTAVAQVVHLNRNRLPNRPPDLMHSHLLIRLLLCALQYIIGKVLPRAFQWYMMGQIWIKTLTIRSLQRLANELADSRGWGEQPVQLPFNLRIW